MFLKGFGKVAGVLDAAGKVGAGVLKSAKNPVIQKAMKSRAITGAVAGGAAGALSKDENGQRGSFSGALKGAALGGAVGAASPLVSKGAIARGKRSWNASASLPPTLAEHTGTVKAPAAAVKNVA